jgi:hypothetical protein
LQCDLPIFILWLLHSRMHLPGLPNFLLSF